jgi:hypothetical protein
VNEAVVASEVATPDELRVIGQRLQDKLELALRPDPPGMERADIHG